MSIFLCVKIDCITESKLVECASRDIDEWSSLAIKWKPRREAGITAETNAIFEREQGLGQSGETKRANERTKNGYSASENDDLTKSPCLISLAQK